MSVKCGATKNNGKPCTAWAIRGVEPPRCVYHTEHRVLKNEVYTAAWVIRRRLKVLDDRVKALCHIKNVRERAQLTLNIINLMERLEERLKTLEQPKPLTYAEKVAAVEDQK
jgi:hypothetical protein